MTEEKITEEEKLREFLKSNGHKVKESEEKIKKTEEEIKELSKQIEKSL